MKNVLLVAPMLEYPPKGGPFLRTLNSIKAINSITELHVVSRRAQRSIGGKQGEANILKYCKSLSYAPSVAGSDQDFNSLFSYFSKYDLTSQVIKFLQRFTLYEICIFFIRGVTEIKTVKADASFIVDQAKKKNCGVIWFTYASISTHLINEVRKIDPKIIIVADTDSVWSRFIKRGIPYQKSLLKKWWLLYVATRKEHEEKLFVSQANVVTAVSKHDSAYYQKISSQKTRVCVFSNTIDASVYKYTKIKTSNKIIHFAGSFGVNSPTDQAIRWFIQEVFPSILKHQSCQLEIVGKGSRLALSDISNENIRVVGEVPSVVPYLMRSSVVIVPLFFESGTRFKILEAGTLKKAVVSTTLGAEGLEVINGQELLIADTASSFAQSVNKLLKSNILRKKLGDRLHTCIVRKYSLSQHIKEAKEILANL